MKEKEKPSVEHSRRRFLKTATKLAIYTPPAMLAVTKPSFASFAQSGGVVVEGSRSKKTTTKKTTTKKVTKKKATKHNAD
jgi:hypothetical protein